MCLEQFKDTKMDKFKSQIEGQKHNSEDNTTQKTKYRTTRTPRCIVLVININHNILFRFV